MIVSRRGARMILIACICFAGADARAQSIGGWKDSTHGRDAVADYTRVFPERRVNRIDIRVAAHDWQRLLADMADMAGPFGRSPIGPGGMAPPQPPPELLAACSGKVEGDTCTFGNPPAAGRCVQIPQSPLACLQIAGPGVGPPFGGGPGGNPPGGQGMDDVEFLPRTPIYIPADVIFEGIAFRRAGLRLKGNSSLMTAWGRGIDKLPFRLNFDAMEDQFPDIRDQTFFGFPNLNLTNNAMDPSMLRAKVVGDMLRDAGVPAPRTAFTRVYLDRGAGPVYLGLYTLVEVPDRPFLRTNFGSDDGNLYKPNGEGGRWTRFIRESFPKKTNEDEEDWTDIEDAIAALQAPRGPASAWRARLEARFDVSGFLRWLAFNTMIGNHDAYGGLSPHNYYLYGSPRHRDRLFWIPWDHDLAMGAEGGVDLGPDGPPPPADVLLPPPGGQPAVTVGGAGLDLLHDRTNASWPLIRYLLDDPTYRAAYRAHVVDLLRSVLDPSRVSSTLRAEHALIAPYAVGPEGEQPGRTFLSDPGDFDASLYGPRGLLKFIAERPAEVRKALDLNQ